MTTKDKVLAEIRRHPGLTASELAQRIFPDNPRQQRVNQQCLQLCEEGFVSRRNEGGGYRYYPVDGSQRDQTPWQPSRSKRKEQIKPKVSLMTISQLSKQLGRNPLFIIPCCGRKRDGGIISHLPNLFMKDDSDMCTARNKCLNFIDGAIETGAAEFGGNRGATYRDACDRYRGDLYQVGGVREILEDTDSVLIMSALYGLIRCRDHIQYYNLEMRFAYRIWREQLGQPLSIYATERRATSVVGLFSMYPQHSYREVFRHIRSQARDDIPSFIISTSPAGRIAAGRSMWASQGLGHMLVYLHEGQPTPPGRYTYEICRVVPEPPDR